MKRLVICCDGTWNELDYRKKPITNVVKLAQSVSAHGSDGQGNQIAQVVFYDEGVGTLEGEALKGGGFANGLEQNILDAYTFLVFNYEPGDEIFVFGFSRGAYTARSLVGLIRNCGIVRRDCAPCVGEAFDMYKSNTIHPDSLEAWNFRDKNGYKGWWVTKDKINDDGQSDRCANLDDRTRLTIAYLGVWDTVGQLGIPGVLNACLGRAEDHGFHDLKLSGMVLRARHAVALDEDRQVFRPTLWDKAKLENLNNGATQDCVPYQQIWFAGDHGSVGGGGDLTGLSDITLKWVSEGAKSNGAMLNYDDSFKAVNYVVKVKAGNRDKITGAISFNPDGNAPLRNVSADYKQAQSAMSRVLGFAMNSVKRERVGDLPALEDIHPTAKTYNGYSGADRDYKSRLIERLKSYTTFRRGDIKSHFP